MKETAKRLSAMLKNEGVDMFISYNPVNTRYLTGLKALTKNDGHAVITAEEAFLLTSFLNKEQAADECRDCRIIVSDDVFNIGRSLKDKKFKRIAIEENYITVKELKSLSDEFTDVEFVDGSYIIDSIKRIKTTQEILNFKTACSLTDDIFECILETVKPGITENDIKDTIYKRMKELSIEECSFPPIIVSGRRSSMPHGMPTDKKLKNGDFLTVDMGFKYENCPSDFTRTVVIGKADDMQKQIYNTVKEAQQKALDCIMPGMSGFEADKLSRDIIEEAGYGKNFGHSLGHGFGDGTALSKESDIILKENMVFTVEPGIYIENYGGVRIEDTVLLTKDGCLPLFKTSKNLIEIY